MQLKMNINQEVKVKLTDFGKEVLKKKHEERYKNLFEKGEYELDLKIDEDGYYEEQLWKLMADFGEYMSPLVEKEKLPFETQILVSNIEKNN